ncbi:MAG: hypothetical protein JWQ40_1364 [Segetibacter sp.]|nr:hypothetical protein [Segetibacter sp.]
MKEASKLSSTQFSGPSHKWYKSQIKLHLLKGDCLVARKQPVCICCLFFLVPASKKELF